MIIKIFVGGKGMICPDCGTNNSTNEAVCTGCGRVLLEAAKGYGKDFALASLVLGLLALVIFPYLYAPLSVLAGLMARKYAYRGKMVLVGIVCSIIGVIGWIVTQFIL